MNLPEIAVRRPTITSFATILLAAGGLAAATQLGQLEDPEFTIKTAAITTAYPGASAEEVELEVTDRLERAVQEMPQVKRIRSRSSPGLSIINVDILARYPSSRMPQIWDELRKRVRDAARDLPPGAGKARVGDDFGDVYGFLLALTGDGFTYAEMEDYADALKKELSLVPGVSRVEFWGVPRRCVYIDVSESRISQLGLTMDALRATLQQQNLVVDSGGLDLAADRLRIEQSGAFRSLEDIGNLVIRGRTMPRLLGGGADDGGIATGEELLRVRDIGRVRRGYVEPQRAIMRYNGHPAIGIAISNRPGVNIVNVGEAIDQRLRELTGMFPVGIEIERISWQSDLVSESIRGFIISLAQAVAIVLVVLCVFMGLSTAFVVGVCGLVLVIVASFLVMWLWGIDLQRMSLGALVIAMGMMVDNAIVVVDGILVRLKQGVERQRAAIEAAWQPAWPLLGATVIAVLAFYPIYASDEGAGEYCASLFQVVAISLLLSWVLSVTVTPLMAVWLLPEPKTKSGDAADDGGKFARGFRNILRLAIRRRWAVLGVVTLLLAASILSFRFVDKTFFPESARLQFMVDYWAPQGTKIQTVSAAMQRIEQKLMDDQRVDAVSAFVGQGPPRFYLPVEPEQPYSCYAQLIVNVHSLEGLNALIPELDTWARANVPEAMVLVRRYGLGPSKTWKVEARLCGLALADLGTLRRLGQRGKAVFHASPDCGATQLNWRQRVQKIVLDYDSERARWSDVTRENVSEATRRAYDGLAIGQYRERDKLLPIVLRNEEADRQSFAGRINVLSVQPDFAQQSVPLRQVVRAVHVDWEDTLIWRWNRRRTVTVQANPRLGVQAGALRDSVVPAFEKLAAELPPGYALEWGGEFEDSRDAQKSLIPGVIPAAVLMALIVVALFNAYRPPLVIVCVIPFVMIGITVGLLITDQPFGFVALLGAMSLSGMMIKNAIVLLDQIDLELAAGKSRYNAVLEATLSRLRPVALAAATTVLGVIPLLQDVFWVSMAVTIMFGLAFGTLLTLVLLPVLYTMLFRVRPQ